MSPRPLAAWSMAALTIALATTNPVYRAVILLAALNVVIALRRPEARLRPLAAGLVLSGLIAVVVTVAVSHAGSDVLLRIPGGIPVLGGAVTVEAIVYGVTTALGIAAVVCAVAPLSLALQPHQLIDALPPLLTRTGAVVGTAVNLLPGLGRSAAEIRDAQRMRGWRARRVREWPDLAVPVVLTALERSMQLAEAMEARGYAATARTRYILPRFDAASAAVATVSVLAAAIFVGLRVAGVAQDWYPYPSLTPPPIDLAALACCAVTALPLLLVRR